MKCPLLCIAKRYEMGAIYPKGGDCLKEECAWWDSAFESCHICSIEWDLKTITRFLNELVQKMPHAGQFLK